MNEFGDKFNSLLDSIHIYIAGLRIIDKNDLHILRFHKFTKINYNIDYSVK